MFIYGSKMYGKKDLVKSWGFCVNCGEYLQLSSYKGRKWGYLYFIPVIPEGPHVHVVKECKRCNVGIHVPEKDVDKTVEDIQADIARALEAVSSGDDYFVLRDDNGNEAVISCISSLIEAAEVLYCVDRGDVVKELMMKLERGGNYKEHLALKGKLFEFEGDLEEAALQYEAAVKNYPGDESAYWLLGTALSCLGRFDEAKGVYEKLLRVSDNEAEVMIELIYVYEKLENFSALAETYENCLSRHPELAKDKKIMMKYKKACKKAGINPR